MTSSALEFLQTWFQAQCNGFWEHANGVTIETLDNSGWMVTVDLAETALEAQSMEPLRKERNAKDWIVCTVDHNQFRGQGDSTKLGQILETFAAWAGGTASETKAVGTAAGGQRRDSPASNS